MATLHAPAPRAVTASHPPTPSRPTGVWHRRYGIPAPEAWPAAASFTVSLTVVATLTALHITNPDVGLVALAMATALCAWRSRAAQALAVGGIAWLFDNGFVAGRLGGLRWRGDADLRALSLMLGCALAAAVIGRVTHP